MIVGDFFRARTWPAIAADARRTPGKVKSSAMIPRQPEVPKWIAWLVTRRYCIVSRKSRVSGIHWGASPKSNGPRAGPKGKTTMTDKIVVLVTCGSAREARTIARELVERRLAACGNVAE